MDLVCKICQLEGTYLRCSNALEKAVEVLQVRNHWCVWANSRMEYWLVCVPLLSHYWINLVAYHFSLKCWTFCSQAYLYIIFRKLGNQMVGNK